MSNYREAKGCLHLGSENEVMQSVREMRGDKTQTCEEWVNDNLEFVSPGFVRSNPVAEFLAKRIDEQAVIEKRDEKMIDLLLARIETLERLAMRQTNFGTYIDADGVLRIK